MSCQELLRVSRSYQALHRIHQDIPVATKNYQELPRAIWTTKSGLEQQRGARSCKELPGAAERYQELP